MIAAKMLGCASLIAAACASAFQPAPTQPMASVVTLLPIGAYPIPAPKLWVEAYHKAEKCLGVKGDVDRVTWYMVPGREFRAVTNPKMTAIGEWEAPHAIVIASDWATTAWLIQHEAVHEILGEGHTPRVDAILQRCHITWGYLAGGEE